MPLLRPHIPPAVRISVTAQAPLAPVNVDNGATTLASDSASLAGIRLRREKLVDLFPSLTVAPDVHTLAQLTMPLCTKTSSK